MATFGGLEIMVRKPYHWPHIYCRRSFTHKYACYIICACCFLLFMMSAINRKNHYNDVIMGVIASQITSLTIVYSTVYSDADQRKHQRSAALAFVWGIHRGPVNSPHKWPVTRKIFPFDDVIMFQIVNCVAIPRQCACVLDARISRPLIWRIDALYSLSLLDIADDDRHVAVTEH